MQNPHKAWLTHIEHLCATANLEWVDVLVDHAGWRSSVLPALKYLQPNVEWFSLFAGTPEEALLAQAPILMRLQLQDSGHKAWLLELLEQAAPQSRVLLLMSPLPFEPLAEQLRALSRLEWAGQVGVLRYFDPRVFSTSVNSVLNPAQKQRFMQLALFWGWLDRDGRPAWQVGCYGVEGAPSHDLSAVQLLDAQFDRLGSIGDAQSLLNYAMRAFPQLSGEQCFAGCYRLVGQASDEGYFGDLNVYAEKHLHGVLIYFGGDDGL